MSRPLRLEYPGAWYHVMNRGRRREEIFPTRQDHETFLEVLRETVTNWNLQIAAYCLMGNHYHLLVHTPDGNLSRGMRHLNGIYTQRFNRRHEKDGPLFRGRYKAILVDADSYLLDVLRYIHRNPLEAGIAETLADYEWSSHHGYLSRAKKWDWLVKDAVLAMLSPYRNRRRAAYVDFISQGVPEEVERFYSLKKLPSILGPDSFQERVSDDFRHLRFHREIPDSRELAPAPEKIIDLVCRHFAISRDELAVSRRGEENNPRDLAIWLVRRACRETLANVGRHFAIDNYSTVSSALQRIKERKESDRKVAAQLRALEDKVAKLLKKT
ncbi:MAG: transposase [Thermodesulfobacteriota bacterium]